MFSDAVDLDPAARAALLDARCGSRAELRAEVNSLLEAHAQSNSFMAAPVVLVAQALAEDRLTVTNFSGKSNESSDHLL